MNISQIETDRLAFFLKGTHDLERIGDHADNIVELAEMKIQDKIILSDDAQKEMEKLITLTDQTLENLEKLLAEESSVLCQVVLSNEDEIDLLTEKLKSEHMRRLNKGECLAYSGILFLDLLANIERIGDHASNIAHDILTVKEERSINKLEEVIY